MRLNLACSKERRSILRIKKPLIKTAVLVFRTAVLILSLRLAK